MQRSFTISTVTAGTSTIERQLPLNAVAAERGLWKRNPRPSTYQTLEIACFALLALSGMAAVLYSVSMFLR